MNDILPFSNIEIIISIRQWSRFDFLLEGVATLLFLNDSSRYILSNFLGGGKIGERVESVAMAACCLCK